MQGTGRQNLLENRYSAIDSKGVYPLCVPCVIPISIEFCRLLTPQASQDLEGGFTGLKEFPNLINMLFFEVIAFLFASSAVLWFIFS